MLLNKNCLEGEIFFEFFKIIIYNHFQEIIIWRAQAKKTQEAEKWEITYAGVVKHISVTLLYLPM